MKWLSIFLFFMLHSSIGLLNGHPPKEKQQGDFRVLYLHYQNSAGEKGVTTFDHDGSEQPARALWQLLDGSRNSINFYTYDQQRRLVKKYREFSDGKTSTQGFKYNAKGQLVYEDFERSDKVKGEVSYHYNRVGRCVRAECNKMNGWFSGVIEYQYNKKGFKSGADIKRKGRIIGKIVYNYDDSGRLKKEYWNFDGKWSQTLLFEYDFYPTTISLPFTSANVFINTNTDYKIEEESYNYSGKGGGPSHYFYQREKLVRKEYSRSDGLKTITHFFYDGRRQLVKSLRCYADGKSGIFTYTHNPARQLIRRTFLMTNGSSAEEQYVYNQAGRLISGTWKNFDSWLSGTLTFNQDAKGRLKKGFFKSEGKKKFAAEILFTHNSFYNLVRILWKLSFKGTQTYTFKYKKIAN